jgi:hypothetical protein
LSAMIDRISALYVELLLAKGIAPIGLKGD